MIDYDSTTPTNKGDTNEMPPNATVGRGDSLFAITKVIPTIYILVTFVNSKDPDEIPQNPIFNMISVNCLLIQNLPSEKDSKYHLSRDMRFRTMWYVRPAKPQTSLRIRAV